MKSFTHALSLLVLSALTVWPATAQHDHSPGDAKPWSQADEIWGQKEMQESRDHMLHHHGKGSQFAVLVDRLEFASTEDEDMIVLDGDAWYGGDVNKLWFKTEAEYALDHDEFEEFTVQALWSRAMSPFFDLQTGIRYDFEPGGQAYGVLGVQGMTPYRFEVDAAAFLSDDGDLSASAEVEYELMLTQRLHLKPRLELGFSASEMPDLGIGSGFTDGAAGVRLSYDIIREFSPYIGVEWQGALGETRDIVSASGENLDETVFVIGFRAWY